MGGDSDRVCEVCWLRTDPDPNNGPLVLVRYISHPLVRLTPIYKHEDCAFVTAEKVIVSGPGTLEHEHVETVQ